MFTFARRLHFDACMHLPLSCTMSKKSLWCWRLFTAHATGCSGISTVSEVSAGAATGSWLDNLVPLRAKYNLFKPSNIAMAANGAESSKLCLKCYQATFDSILILCPVDVFCYFCNAILSLFVVFYTFFCAFLSQNQKYTHSWGEIIEKIIEIR